jgi:putative spermidine/putrescine transport system ATP-binding protein
MHAVTPKGELGACEVEKNVRSEGVKQPLGISICGARKSYGNFVALNDVSLKIGPGEFLTLLGPSGSGKTTLLNIISGFVPLEQGSIFFGDQDVTARPVNERGLGIVFQSYALFPHLTVGENVAFPLKIRKVNKVDIKNRVNSVLGLVKLDKFADRKIASLSGGQRQRVALARAIVFSPQIVLMDEPLSALDKTLREQMQVEIRHLHSKIGATTIYVTHDQREALTMSDRIAVMNHGNILQCDTPRTIYESPCDSFVAGFVGEATLLPVKRGAGGVTVGDGTLLRLAKAPASDGKLVVVLRAERILMPEECHDGVNRLPVTVTDVIYQGDSLLLLCDIAGHSFSVRRPMRGGTSGTIPARGTKMDLGLALEDTLIVPAAT